MSQKSRTYNSIVNSLVGIVSAILNVALNFFVRIVIVRALGEEINGLHSLFQNMINIMAVVESSMCTAMIIHLYGPIEHSDTDELNDILSLYHRIYVVLAIVFFAVATILNLFLDAFVTASVPSLDMHVYFFVFTLSVVVNYLTYTYRIVLFAAQKNRISAMATLVAEIIFRGGAALTAIFLKSYTVFLLCFIGEKLLGNLICRFYVRRTYSGISCMKKNADQQMLRSTVMKTVKPLLVSRVADILQNSSQSILISIFLGNIAIVGYYGNYTLVIGSVGLLFSQLGAAFTSSFGNLATKHDQARMFDAFKKSEFVMTSIAIVICSGFIVCIQDFISWVFGPNFLLKNSSMAILAATMYITLLNIPAVSVQNATGRHDTDVRNMILQAICSIGLGSFGGAFFGMEGILIGMLLPLFFFTTICKNIIIQRSVFDRSIAAVLYDLAVSGLKGISIFIMVASAASYVALDSILLNILIKGVIAICISTVGIFVLSLRNRFLWSTIHVIGNTIRKK